MISCDILTVEQTGQIKNHTLFDKHVLLANVYETFQKHFLHVNVSQARVCVVAKPTNIVLDMQISNVYQTMSVSFARA